VAAHKAVIVQATTARSAERHVAGTIGCVGLHQGAMVMKTLIANVLRDEQGGEVLEYALIAGLIVVAAIAVITSVGGKVVAKWNSVSTGLN